VYKTGVALVALVSENLRGVDLLDSNQLRFIRGDAKSEVDPTVSTFANKFATDPPDSCGGITPKQSVLALL